MKEIQGAGNGLREKLRKYASLARKYFGDNPKQAWAACGVGIVAGSSVIGAIGPAGILVAIPILAIALLAGWTVTEGKKSWYRVVVGAVTLLCLSAHNLSTIIGDAAILACFLGAIAIAYRWYHPKSGSAGRRGTQYYRDSLGDSRKITRGRNSHYNADQSAKRSYPTEAQANVVAARQGSDEGTVMNSYKCGECTNWHIGHAR